MTWSLLVFDMIENDINSHAGMKELNDQLAREKISSKWKKSVTFEWLKWGTPHVAI